MCFLSFFVCECIFERGKNRLYSLDDPSLLPSFDCLSDWPNCLSACLPACLPECPTRCCPFNFLLLPVFLTWYRLLLLLPQTPHSRQPRYQRLRPIGFFIREEGRRAGRQSCLYATTTEPSSYTSFSLLPIVASKPAAAAAKTQ